MFASLTLAFMVAGAADTLELKPLFKKGDVYYSTSKQAMEQVVSVAGMDMNQKMTQTTVTKFEVKDLTDNSVVIKLTYLDSQTEAENIPGAGDMSDKLKGIVLIATIDLKKRTVSKLEGYDEFIEKAGGDDEMAKKLLKSTLSQETMKQNFAELVSWMPSKPVAVGETWNQEDKMPLGPIGSMKLNTKHKLEKFDANTAVVSYTADLSYTPPDGADGGLPFKIAKGDLSSDKFGGSRTYDRKTGRIVESTTTGVISGTLTISVAGQELPLSLKQNLKVTTKITDKNPLDEK